MSQVDKREDDVGALPVEDTDQLFELWPHLRAREARWACKVDENVFVVFISHQIFVRVSIEGKDGQLAKGGCPRFRLCSQELSQTLADKIVDKFLDRIRFDRLASLEALGFELFNGVEGLIGVHDSKERVLQCVVVLNICCARKVLANHGHYVNFCNDDAA